MTTLQELRDQSAKLADGMDDIIQDQNNKAEVFQSELDKKVVGINSAAFALSAGAIFSEKLLIYHPYMLFGAWTLLGISLLTSLIRYFISTGKHQLTAYTGKMIKEMGNNAQSAEFEELKKRVTEASKWMERTKHPLMGLKALILMKVLEVLACVVGVVLMVGFLIWSAYNMHQEQQGTGLTGEGMTIVRIYTGR